jgi:hypothetical protein
VKAIRRSRYLRGTAARLQKGTVIVRRRAALAGRGGQHSQDSETSPVGTSTVQRIKATDIKRQIVLATPVQNSIKRQSGSKGAEQERRLRQLEKPLVRCWPNNRAVADKSHRTTNLKNFAKVSVMFRADPHTRASVSRLSRNDELQPGRRGGRNPTGTKALN